MLLRQKSKIPVYNEEEREGLRNAGRFNAQAMDFLRPHVQPGVTTAELDKLVHDFTLDHGHTPATLGYQVGSRVYEKSICTSINEVVCHGIPDETVLKEGDIVNCDLTTIVDGWYGDQSEMFLIGEVSENARRLVQVTFDALYIGIEACSPGCRVFQIGKAIHAYAKKHNVSVVQEYQGHGLGREFHQEPGIPHFPHPSSYKDILAPGVCFTIEPMLNEGTYKTEPDPTDGWTVRTEDRKLSAQFEHTILMTEDGPEILTMTEHGPQPGHQF